MRGLEQAKYQAKRSFKRRIAKKETLNPAIIAKVGNGAGTVVVSGRPGWIYVRLHGDDNQLTEAKLGIPLDTASLNDAWVRVKKASPRKASYYVVQEFITSSTGNPAPPMSAHPLDPDDGPHTGPLTEDDVAFDDVTGHDHQGAGGTGKKVDHANLASLTTDNHHPKDHAASHKSGGADELDVKDLPDSEGRLLTGPQKTDLTDGGTTTLHQHAGGMTSAVEIMLTNRTGGERTAGDVVVVDPSNDESFIGTSQQGYVGKVFVVAETIADLTGGLCWERGGPFDAKVIGTVSRNDGLRTSATIYRAEAAPSITGGGVFAIALSPNISGEGTVKAVFLDAIGGGGAGGDGDGAPTDAKYIVTEEHASLTAEIVRPQLAQYSPDTPPSGPSSYDDEFEDGALDVKWTKLVSGGVATENDNWGFLDVSANPEWTLNRFLGFLGLKPESAVGGEMAVYESFAPSSETAFTIIVKVAVSGDRSHVNAFRLELVKDDPPPSGDPTDGIFVLSRWDMGTPGSDILSSVKHNGGETDGVDLHKAAGIGGDWVWLMIVRKTDNSLYSFFSNNGINWIPLLAGIAGKNINTAPKYIVLKMRQSAAGARPSIAIIDYIRVFEGAVTDKIGGS